MKTVKNRVDNRPPVKPTVKTLNPSGVLYGIVIDAYSDMREYDGIANFIDIATLIPLITGLFSLFQNCPKKTNPTPTPPVNSGITQAAWDKAWDSKSAANRGYLDRRHRYKRPLLAKMQDQMMSDAKINGITVTPEDVSSFGASMLDQARDQDLITLAKGIMEHDEVTMSNLNKQPTYQTIRPFPR